MNTNRKFNLSCLLILPMLARWDNCALLLLRMVIGIFLIWGVLDNITSAARMKEFADFLAGFGFPYPDWMAPLSVWAQFLVGVAFITGLLTRWAGIVCAIHFVIAIGMVDANGGIRAAFPSTCLVLIGLYLATHGPGSLSVDRFIEKRLRSSRNV
jgi:putative oxidoreductase